MDLSVICPIHNNAKTMLPMITSFQQQDIGNYEIEYIFICNGCRDNSEEMLHRLKDIFQETFKNCKILHEDFSDTGLARQKGVDVSTGDYIAFCDMDDWLLSKTTFKDLLDCTKLYPNTLIQFGFDLPKKDYFFITEDNNISWVTYWHVKNKMTCTVWRYLFPRFIFKKYSFNENLKGKDDLNLFQQMANDKSIKITVLNRNYYFWNYMDLQSYSYKEMMKNRMLTKEQFLNIMKDPKDIQIKEELKHLL